jgi:hypothetical protein
VKVAASTVWEILKDAGIDPAPERASSTWVAFLRSPADALLACDFFETVTLCGTRMYALAVIEHHTRRIRVLGATAHPTASWVTQAARNLVMDLQDAGYRARFLMQRAELAARGTDDGGYVFTNVGGRPISPDRLSINFGKLITATGLPPVRLHDLRHGAASLALQAGADLKVVQDQLGHSSIVLTADTYVTVLPEVARKNARKHRPPRAGCRALRAGLTTRTPANHPADYQSRISRSTTPTPVPPVKGGAGPGPTTASPWPHHQDHSSTVASKTAGQQW